MPGRGEVSLIATAIAAMRGALMTRPTAATATLRARLRASLRSGSAASRAGRSGIRAMRGDGDCRCRGVVLGGAYWALITSGMHVHTACRHVHAEKAP